MIPILGSFIIAFILYPLYKKILSKIKSENLSALIISFLIVLIIAIPTLFMINVVTNQVTDIYSDITIKLSEDEKLISVECQRDSALCKAINIINENPKIRFYISGAIINLASSITRNTSSFLFSLPKKILDALIIFLLVFFLLKEGEIVWNKLKELLPLKITHKEKLLKKFFNTVNGVVYGYLIIALIEAVIAWVAFVLVGSKIALILGIIIGIMALIPMIGAPIIWIPASMIYFFSGFPIKAIILIVAGIIIMVLDLWIRAKVIGTRTDIHPIVVALGVLGGVITFGPVGVVLGPVVLSLLIASIEIYQIERDSFV